MSEEKRKYEFKPVDDLEFTDDFMFGTIMQNEEICKGVLERLLKKPIAKIIYPQLQENVSPFYQTKGIRLDVYVENENVVYDIEMQCKKLDAIEKRVRYYQSMIDVDNLSKGADYSELKESYVIFICKTDPFSYNCPSYEVKSMIEGITFVEKENEVEQKNISVSYEDGTHKLFFNAKAYQNETNDNLKAFLHYVSTTEATDDFTKKLEEKIMMTKQIDKFRNDYLSYNIHEQDIRKEERKEALSSVVKNLLNVNSSIDFIANMTGLSIFEVNEIINNFGKLK